MIFIRPIAAPIKVINPMAAAEAVMLLKKPINSSANLSLFSTTKLSSSIGSNFLTALKSEIASPLATSISFTLPTIIPIK